MMDVTASVNPRVAQHFKVLSCSKCRMSPGFGMRKLGVESQCSLHFCSSSGRASNAS